MTTHEISLIMTEGCPEGETGNCIGCDHFCGVLRGRNEDNEVIYNVDCSSPKNKKNKTR